MKNKNGIKSILLIIVILVLIIVFRETHLMELLRSNKIGITEFRDYLLSFGNGCLFVLLLIYMLKPLLVITPISVLAVATGLIYGPVYGTVYSMVGAMLSACTGFFISRFLGQGIVDKLLRGKRPNIDGNIEKNGFSIIFFLRLAFIFPYDPLSYAAGMSKMKFFHFIAGTMLGILPEMFAYNYLGTSIDDMVSKRSIFAILIIVIFAGGTILMRKRKKQQS